MTINIDSLNIDGLNIDGQYLDCQFIKYRIKNSLCVKIMYFCKLKNIFLYFSSLNNRPMAFSLAGFAPPPDFDR